MARVYRVHGEESYRLIEEFFATRDEFIVNAGFTVGVFVTQIGKLVARRQSRPRSGVQGVDETNAMLRKAGLKP